MEDSLMQQMVRAGSDGARAKTVQGIPNGRVSSEGEALGTMSVKVPALNQVLLQELRLLAQRRADCAKWPDAQKDSQRTVVGRGSGTKRIKVQKEQEQ